MELNWASLFNSVLQIFLTRRRGEEGCNGGGVGEKHTLCTIFEEPSTSAHLSAFCLGTFLPGRNEESFNSSLFLTHLLLPQGHGWEESLAILAGSKNSTSLISNHSNSGAIIWIPSIIWHLPLAKCQVPGTVQGPMKLSIMSRFLPSGSLRSVEEQDMCK